MTYLSSTCLLAVLKKKIGIFWRRNFGKTDSSLARQDLCHMQILLHRRSNANSNVIFLFSADCQSDSASERGKVTRTLGKENKSQNPLPSIIQLPTSPNYLVINFGPTTKNYSSP